jgi:hypothetical protein
VRNQREQVFQKTAFFIVTAVKTSKSYNFLLALNFRVDTTVGYGMQVSGEKMFRKASEETE